MDSFLDHGRSGSGDIVRGSFEVSGVSHSGRQIGLSRRVLKLIWVVGITNGCIGTSQQVLGRIVYILEISTPTAADLYNPVDRPDSELPGNELPGEEPCEDDRLG